MRRKAAHTLVAVAVIPFTATGSEDTLTEETIVTASFTGANSASAAPIHVLDGEQIAQSGAQSLGEHIDSLLGVSPAVTDARFSPLAPLQLALFAGCRGRPIAHSDLLSPYDPSPVGLVFAHRWRVRVSLMAHVACCQRARLRMPSSALL